MKDVGPKLKNKGGRPYTYENLPMEDLITIMINHGYNGGFFQTLPSEIYRKTNHLISVTWLNKIDDAEFLAAKSLAKSASLEFWTEQMKMACIPAAVWIWITKNLGDFRENRNIVLELSDTSKSLTPEEQEQKQLQLRLMLKEVAR